jgi:hypothetical protein
MDLAQGVTSPMSVISVTLPKLDRFLALSKPDAENVLMQAYQLNLTIVNHEMFSAAALPNLHLTGCPNRGDYAVRVKRMLQTETL